MYQNMLGYNMFAYCDNNPVNYYDPTGESAEAVLGGWMYSMWWLHGLDEPLPIGDILYWTVAGILGLVVIGGIIYAATSNSPTQIADDPPRSLEEPNDTTVTEKKSRKEREKEDKEKDYVRARSNKKANQWAEKVGYNNAEDLKSDFVGNKGSRFNLFKNRPTREIILIGIEKSIEIFTDLFVK